MSTPYIGFTNETLARCPPLAAGDVVECPRCGERHVVEGAMLLWYQCGLATYVAGVDGRCTMGVRADCKGSVE